MTEFEEKYLKELSKSYKTREECATEIIKLNAILGLPKGTEHFVSDLHGEWEAFSHIRRTASGVAFNKINALFEKTLSEKERRDLAMLVYYPEECLLRVTEEKDEYLSKNIERLVALCDLVSKKYTRDFIREHISRIDGGFDYVIGELLFERGDGIKKEYRNSIIKTAIRTGVGDCLTIALASLIKSLLIDRLHVVGDIFDRGPRPDLIIDELMKEKSIDVEWGNHDALWMAAAMGSEVAIATVLNNSMTYKNLDIIEIGYGISLRALEEFSERTYKHSDLSIFLPKGNSGGNVISEGSDEKVARMHKAIAIIQFKLEGEAVLRNPSFKMEGRLLLDKIDKKRGTVTIADTKYKLRDTDFPTVNTDSPYALTEGERAVMKYLSVAFMRSERLSRQIRFLFEKGSMYKVYNGNLIFHGAVPMTEDGELMPLEIAGGLSGRALLDYCDGVARRGIFSAEDSKERSVLRDFLWFLWCGRNSPLSGRERICGFERLFIDDERAHTEPKNPYYKVWEDKGLAEKILKEFGLDSENSKIINGHIPIQKGESPIKGGGRVIVIDGGFCKAFHTKTGIGGYTLIYNSDGMRLCAHKPFTDKASVLSEGDGLLFETSVFEYRSGKKRIRECDLGDEIRGKIIDLTRLISEYERGTIKEDR